MKNIFLAPILDIVNLRDKNKALGPILLLFPGSCEYPRVEE
jgi:hypothetical protein